MSETLDSGIRETVAFLNEHDFVTTDSGDGIAKFVDGEPPECALPFPHVAIKAEPIAMISVAQRLREVLEGAGIKIGEVSPDETAPAIQANYDPVSDSSTVILIGVNDRMLAKARGKRLEWEQPRASPLVCLCFRGCRWPSSHGFSSGEARGQRGGIRCRLARGALGNHGGCGFGRVARRVPRASVARDDYGQEAMAKLKMAIAFAIVIALVAAKDDRCSQSAS